MSWYRLELHAALDDITDRAWREVWIVAYADAPPDPTNALFRTFRKGALSTLYFSPAAHDLARTFGAIPCKKPSGEKLVLVAGDTEACDLHFSGGRISRPAELLATPVPSAFASTLPSSSFPTTQAV